MKNIFLKIGFIFLVLPLIIFAQSAPEYISYQGRLTDNTGQPLDSLITDMYFTFYDQATNGTILITVMQEDVWVYDGLFNVLIGSGSIFPGSESLISEVFQKNTYVWLGITVGTDSEMTPRTRIGSTAYALKSQDGVPKGAILMWSGALADIPSGWQLCDGTNGTPDLLEKFIMGVSAAQEPGTTGGSSFLSLSTPNLPGHTHSFTTSGSGTHTHRQWEYVAMNADFWIGGIAPTSMTYDVSIDVGGGYVNSGAGGDHSHTGATDSIGSGTAFDNRPAFYQLAYIMKL